MKKRILTYPDPEYADGDDDGGDAPTGDENSAAEVQDPDYPNASSLDHHAPCFEDEPIQYKPFKPIPREVMGIFQRSWWDKTWHDRRLLFQVFWNVSLAFSSYSMVFVVAIFFTVVTYKNGMTRTIQSAVTDLGIEAIENQMQTMRTQLIAGLNLIETMALKENNLFVQQMSPRSMLTGLSPLYWQMWAGWSIS